MAKAFDNIEAAQTEQRDQQDARHKILPEKLKIGTKVYLKAPGLLVKNKLNEAFFGPYRTLFIAFRAWEIIGC